MLADRHEIERRLPHAGKMCLLDGIISVSDTAISCRAVSHLDPDNPLRNKTGLPVTTALEYAAQAMALHANSTGTRGGVQEGVLAAAHDFEMLVERLDRVGEVLVVCAQRLGSMENGFKYSFTLQADEQMLARGKATIMYSGNTND